MTTPDQPADAAAHYAAVLLTEAREELNRADAKASFAFAGVSIGLSAVVAGMIGGDWHPSDLTPECAQVAWWAGALGGIAAVVFLAAAVYPRTVHSHKAGTAIRFFGHAAEMKSVDALRAALERDASLDARAFDQLWEVSRIVKKKYTHLRRAFRCLGGGAVLVTIALVWDALA